MSDSVDSAIQLIRSLDDGYRQSGALSDLDTAIQGGGAALAEIPADHPSHSEMGRLVCNFHTTRYKRLGAVSDLQTAIEHAEAVLAETPESSPKHASRLGELSNLLHSRYHRLGALEDLEAAITHTQGVLTTIPVDHPVRVELLNNLGDFLSTRYKRLEKLDDLETAIEHGTAALTATPDDRPKRAKILNTLSQLYHTKYGRLGDPGDLKAAIEHSEASLTAIAVDHPNRALIRTNLSKFLHTKYGRFGALADLEAAIEHIEAALAAIGGDDPNRAAILNTLGILLGTRYDRLGVLSNLEAAIEHTDAALIMIPGDHPSRAAILDNLSSWLVSRYERLGILTDLESAIGHAKGALLTLPQDHPTRVTILNTLSNLLASRYKRLGALSDLEEATEHAKGALAALPEGHQNRSLLLSNLSIRIASRYQRLGVSSDLESAIEYAKRALIALPDDHPTRVVTLNILSNLLISRFGTIGELSDLEEAISHVEGALRATPNDSPYRAGRLTVWGKCLVARWKRFGVRRDLNAVIDNAQAALEATPPDHPNRATVWSDLGIYLLFRYTQTGSDKDRERSLRSFIEAWNSQLSPPLTRVLAARIAVKHYHSLLTWEESSRLLGDAVLLMPKISLRFLEREDQQELLSPLYELSSEAASFALQAGQEPSHALKLLELGRGIITGFIIDYRSELSELKESNPNLFNSFTQLRNEINSSPDISDGPRDQSKDLALQTRKQAKEAIELTLSEIRQLPAYTEFLLPPAPKDLMKMAQFGPIVAIITTYLRSDAIIVTTSAIKAINLPNLVYDDAKVRMRQMTQEILRGKLPTYAARNVRMAKFLIWLWDVAVEPVLEELQLSGPIDDASVNRMWWIGVGELSMAPFHAAGYHARGSSRNTLTRVISSYTPTIKALSYARRKKLNLASKPDTRLLLVTMPTTPGKTPLRKVEQETNTIVGIVKKGTTQTRVLRQPSAAVVLEQLQLYDAVHFACHGISDNRNPSNSSLFLLDSSQSGNNTIDHLTVQMISSANTEHAQLAYLSACSTAENSAFKLADETIHLASAFQLAGFSHVLATMWPSNDSACMEVATGFYSSLFGGQASDNGHRTVGTAMHDAVKRLRDKRPDKPLIWAPFIHTGA